MSSDPRRRATDRSPHYLLPGLVVLILIGLVSIGLLLRPSEVEVARKGQVDEATALLDTLVEAQHTRAERTAESHRVICETVVELAREYDLDPDPCPPPPDGTLP